MDHIVENEVSLIRRDLSAFESKVRGKTFLVTGGAGFLGSWFCDVLIALGSKTICVDNLRSGSETNIQHLMGTRNFKLLKKDACKITIDEKIDYIVNMASIASPRFYQEHPIETLDVNIVGTRNMLECARKNEVEGFLTTSTSEIYGDAAVFPTPESYWGNVNSFGPRCMYDEGKRAAEAYCYSYIERYNLPIRIARIFNTYGPRLDVSLSSQYGRAISTFIRQALDNKPLTVHGTGSQTRSFCYVTDQIEGLFKLLLTPGLDGEIVNIGNDEETSIITLARLITELTNTKSQIIFEPSQQDDPKRRKPDINKAKSLMKWLPKVNLEKGLKKTIAWMSK